jgi:hypothetical protein
MDLIASVIDHSEERSDALRLRLIEKLNAQSPISHMSGDLVGLSVEEGIQTHAGRVLVLVNRKESEDIESAVRGYFMDALLRGADDGWSGRTNDLQRSLYDGLRSVSSRILGFLD